VKINFGCGSDYRPGWLNIDQFDNRSPDLVMDLERLPWPIEDNFAEHILLKHVLEHVGHDSRTFLGIMKELYRVSKPGATIEIHVRHPWHNDFLGDPTHVRPILPETFQSFDLAAVEQWQARGLPRTPLAVDLQVDFESIDTQYFLDPLWQERLSRGEIDMAAVSLAARSHGNVIQWMRSVLRVRKPFTPGRSLQGLTELRIVRTGGLGDVMMALAAAHAIAKLSKVRIVFETSPSHHSLAAACPFIAEVVSADDAVAEINARFAKGDTRRSVSLDAGFHGVSRNHEVDSFLKSGFGIHAPAALKGFRIEPDVAAQRRVAERLASLGMPPRGARVLLHPSNRDRNRTWPQQNWQELASRLRADGHQLLSIGQRDDQGNGVFALDDVVDLVGEFSPLETIALMNSAELLVATDSGPVQLAGSTDIGIVGLYSVVAGRNRLPYRNGELGWRAVGIAPSCEFHPCYSRLLGSEEYAAHRRAGPTTFNDHAKFASEWCLHKDRYVCLNQEITIERVYDACRTLLGTAPAEGTQPT
jgi:ADP-heptose:LPS heptosyltransferase